MKFHIQREIVCILDTFPELTAQKQQNACHRSYPKLRRNRALQFQRFSATSAAINQTEGDLIEPQKTQKNAEILCGRESFQIRGTGFNTMFAANEEQDAIGNIQDESFNVSTLNTRLFDKSLRYHRLVQVF